MKFDLLQYYDTISVEKRTKVRNT